MVQDNFRKKSRSRKYKQYIGIEKGLEYANRKYICINKNEMEIKREYVELIVNFLVKLMLKLSPTFKYLYVETFGGGSVYDNLKITKPDEFDFDILMRIPAFLGPKLRENNIPGYINLQLLNFHKLKRKNPEVYREMKIFIDDKKYLLTKEMKQNFMQSVFDQVMNKIYDKDLQIGTFQFKIKRVQSLGPAFTLTIEGFKKFNLKVDFVPCIILDKSHWPGGAFRSNPYSTPSDFFIVPKSPKREIPHIERYWRLSFQKQERELIFDCQWLKPTIRILKRIRDHFGHKISSYALKNMFLNVLEAENPDFIDEVPKLWLSPLSYCLVYMLGIYVESLSQGAIPYFWNSKMNLIEDLTHQQKIQYLAEIEGMLEDIEANPLPQTILKYLR